MSNLIAFELGHAGFEHVKDELTLSGPLSFLVWKLYEGNGRIFAPLLPSTPSHRVTDFETSAQFTMDISEDWLGNFIQSQWGGPDRCQLVFEDPWLDAKDYFVSKPPPIRYFISHDKMYLCPEGRTHQESIEDGMRETRNFRHIGFVISPSVAPLPTGSQASDAYMEQLALNTQAVFISAYDQDSFVIWQRED